ncbi:MAG: S1 RNA-binding domain-containing protein [Candidatus Gastranaerophilales bacterium]|nr:S1 RNA-binding domain-containing protein [Candidatus Gastranaerophilales bacterium]
MTKTLEKPMTEFERLLNESFNYSFKAAELVKGTIVKIDSKEILVDIGAKSEAVLPLREVAKSDLDGETALKEGDEREFLILKEEDEEGVITLSLKRVSLAQNWEKLDQIRQNNETINVQVVALVKGGVVVEVMELRGFVPSSQLRTGTPFEGLIGTELEVKVIESDPKKNKLILSQRLALAEQREQIVGDVINNLEVDQEVEGQVVRIADFGAFVDINGVDGLLPISEISWQRIKHPADVLQLGKTIKVRILKIDNDLNRISLSLKRMGENPWTKIEGQFKEGQVVTGEVNKITSFGAFINIFPGVEALLPAAEMGEGQVNPYNVVNVGDEIEVLIKRFTPQEHRIGLSLKDVELAKRGEYVPEPHEDEVMEEQSVVE